MHSNLKLINPLKENELFSVHNYKKKTLSNYSSNSFFNNIYRPLNTQKFSITSLHKNKNIGSTFNEINRKSKSNYNLKLNSLSYIPYPSFPNNNRIPTVFKNSHKMIKYPKIKNNNFTVYNFNKPKQKHIFLKNILFNKKSNSTINHTKKDNRKQNRTFGGEIKFFQFNEFFNNKNNLEKSNNYINKKMNSESYKNKITEKKQKIKVDNFTNIQNNIIHLIEMRDERNNNIIYTKVTNLLLDEINKLYELEKKRMKLKKFKDQGTNTYIKIKKKRKRKLKLVYDENDSTFGKMKHRKSLVIKSIDLRLHHKYGFEFIDESSFDKGEKSDLSSTSKDISFKEPYKDSHKYNTKYKNEYGQTNESVFKKDNNNYFNIKKNELNINGELKINDNYGNINLNNDNNKKNGEFIFDNKNKAISIFSSFIKDSKKKSEKNSNLKIFKEYKENKEKQENQENFDNERKFDFSNLLNNLSNKILHHSKKKLHNTKRFISRKKEIPLFEQMVKKEKLIKLIHEYMNNKKEDENNEEEEEIKDDENNEENKEEIEGENNNGNNNINNIDYSIHEEGNINGNDNNINNIDKIYNFDNANNNYNIDNANNIGNEINERQLKIINDNYKENFVIKNKKIERRKKRAKTHTITKIELGKEIIKHICDEINMNQDDKDNLEICLFNLMKIARKEKKTEKEENLQKKILKPIDEIIQKYLENMLKINASNERPNALFNNTLKSFLREKLKEILNISSDDNNEDEKKNLTKKKKQKEPSKKSTKKLIYDNSYFFKKEKKRKESIENNKINLSINKNDDDETNKNLGSSTSLEYTSSPRNKIYFKKKKFVKTKRSIMGLKIIKDEKEEKMINKILKKVENEFILTNEDMLDKRLQSFFEQIRLLKSIQNSKDEEKLRMFIDKEMDKFDYTLEKRVEARKYNFFHELKVARLASKNGKHHNSNKLLFHSPIIFYKNKE